ncbi:MAG: hypothetical protein HOE62_18475 [Alphaproteobacteria bacterium]|jgi:hypothetical protein|nr:hypothetical protein [Alphaproteobacteria bacterium]MBT4019945.1 hypothetical protein [Alphaproteobacteria bacterium]MBT4966744.1 hypothetical protein [Alphaproteobacteria bacterium]MBT5158451.1 hypothetical protein [Alphaproteobacteria bacterium]MBT5919230.1 hypothetical protein [Alphaproteobacteria bacterium]
MEKLKTIVEAALVDLGDIVAEDQKTKAAKIIEAAVIKGMLEAQHRAVDACNRVGAADRDMAHKIATEIRQKNDALIVNLSAMY